MAKKHVSLKKEEIDTDQSQDQKEDNNHKEMMISKTSGDMEKSLLKRSKRLESSRGQRKGNLQKEEQRPKKFKVYYSVS